MKRSFLQILVLSLVLMVPVAAAQALPEDLPDWLQGDTVVGSAGPQDDLMMVTAMMLDANSASTNVSADGESVTFMNGSMSMPGMWEWTWMSLTLEHDPTVSFVGGFTNIGTMPTDFAFAISTPISPALPSTLYGGQTIVTYLDPDLSGGSLTNDSSNNPAYAGSIDGTAVLNMLTTLNLTVSATAASESQGLPGPTLPDGPANSSIGILHRFNLSAGDQATFNSSFAVVIPEPGTIALLAAGLGGLALLGRRRQI